MTKTSRLPVFLSPLLIMALTSPALADQLRCETILGGRQEKVKTEDVVQDNVDDVRLPSQEEIMTNAKALVFSLENNYGPRILKKTTIGLNWEKSKKQFLKKMRGVKTYNEMLFAMSDFLNFNDAHISDEVGSSLRWLLPMQFSYTTEKQKYVLNFINRDIAQQLVRGGELPPLKAELVGVNGQSMDEFQKKFPAYHNSGNAETNKEIFAMRLTAMAENGGINLSSLPSSVWKFDFQWNDEKTGQLVRRSVDLQYIKTGVPIIDGSTVLPPDSPSMADILVKFLTGKLNVAQDSGAVPLQLSPSLLRLEKLARKMNGFANGGLKRDKMVEEFSLLGHPEGTQFAIGQDKPVFKMPKDFKPIVLPDSIQKIFKSTDIFAGTFKRNGKRVGYLRIPSYEPTSIVGAPFAIAYIVRVLEMSTDYLMLDQMNNPGGSVAYGDMWVQALVGQVDPAVHLKFKVKPTQNFMREYAEALLEFDQESRMVPSVIRDPLLKTIREQFEIVQAAYRSGEPLSDPVSLYPMSQLLLMSIFSTVEVPDVGGGPDLFNSTNDPNGAYSSHYTKPIIGAINDKCFSGGDAMPATLTDHGRATFVGLPTAGAGGTVEEFSLRIGEVEFKYRLTTSLMYRPAQAQHYVENFRVQPMYRIETTAQDPVNNFQNFFDKWLTIAEQVAAGKMAGVHKAGL